MTGLAPSSKISQIGPVARAALIAAIACLCCFAARELSFGAPIQFLFWPAGAVALAFAWRHGLAWSLPAAAGAALFGFLEFGQIPLALLAGALCLPGATAAVLILRRLNEWKPADFRLESTLRFVVVGTLIAAPIDAALATAGLWQFGAASSLLPLASPAAPIPLASTFLVCWLLDALGLMLLTPALLAWILPPGNEAQQDAAEPAPLDPAALLLAAVLVVVTLLLPARASAHWSHTLLYFYFPIIAWTAVRGSERTTALTLLATGLPLLAARAWTMPQAPEAINRGYESCLLLLCTVMVAQLLQAVSSDRRLALIRVARQARQDMSTGLLNDRGLLAELGERLVSPQRTHYGLIGVHLTNFDALNDLCGPMQALQLEQNTAHLLLRQPQAILGARLSAGRYALLVTAETVTQVRTLARDVYAQLNGQVFRIDHGSLRLQVSVGGLLIDRHVVINGEDCMLSLSDALAIAASVRDPQLFVEPLSQTMIDTRRAHQGKVEHIREAIRDQRFDIHAQPIVDPDANGNNLSYEVLIRLRDRDGGLIRPMEFMPLAIQAQLTVAMDRGVIHSVFEFLSRNPEALARTHKCSINLSGLTMSDGTIAGYIREQRTQYDIPPEKIVFEITEGEAIRNPAAASRLVDDLKADGFGIALDDFGTGLATFEYLKRFPLDYLKIDGTFIRNLIANPIDEEIVLATIRVARRLNVKTVAEHVHSREIYDRLRELGVEYIQGELISVPRPIAEMFAAPRSELNTSRSTGRNAEPAVIRNTQQGTESAAPSR